MKAKSLEQVIAAEAGGKTRAQRLADMKNIYSSIVNRAKATGVAVKDVFSVQSQYNAYNNPMPPGTAALTSLAKQAIEEVNTLGPTHTGLYYATHAAVGNLPKGLVEIPGIGGVHKVFDDPKNRPVKTAAGVKKVDPTAIAAPVEAKAASGLLSSLFGARPEAASPFQSQIAARPETAGALPASLMQQRNNGLKAVQAGLLGNVMAPSALATDLTGGISAAQRAMAGEALDPRGDQVASTLGRDALQMPDPARFMGMPTFPDDVARVQAAFGPRSTATVATRPEVPAPTGLPAAPMQSMVASRPNTPAPTGLPAARMQSMVATRPEVPAPTGLPARAQTTVATRPEVPASTGLPATRSVSALNAAPRGVVERGPALSPVSFDPRGNQVASALGGLAAPSSSYDPRGNQVASALGGLAAPASSYDPRGNQVRSTLGNPSTQQQISRGYNNVGLAASLPAGSYAAPNAPSSYANAGANYALDTAMAEAAAQARTGTGVAPPAPAKPATPATPQMVGVPGIGSFSQSMIDAEVASIAAQTGMSVADVRSALEQGVTKEAMLAYTPATVLNPPPPTYNMVRPALEEVAAQRQPAAPPPATAYDVYAGRSNYGLDNMGREIGRLADGTTTVTNQYGKTTGMTPGGYQTAVGSGAISGPLGQGGIQTPEEQSQGGLLSKAGSTARGFVNSPVTKGAAMGMTVGGLPGAIVGGLLGAAMRPGGALSGSHNVNTAMANALGHLNGWNIGPTTAFHNPVAGGRFPGAPSNPGTTRGFKDRATRDHAYGMSPGAAAAIDKGLGGLY